MDKYEYKIRVDEIRDLISQNKYEEASEIADTIDWSRVKKAPVLCMISDLYKKVKRYEDALELLQMADTRYPGSKNIIFSLCELYLVIGETIPAISAYKEFCTVAGNDIRRYVLQYKVYEAQGVSLEERIEVLEELKKRDYRPKWAYTLAYLYHRIGLATKCIDECDNLILYFGGSDSDYVYMAMELKMLHQPLTPSQQAEYDNHKSALFSDMRWEQAADGVNRIPKVPTNTPAEGTGSEVSGDTTVLTDEDKKKISESMALSMGYTQVYHGENNEELEISVKPVDMGEYNTINLQKAIAEGIQEVLQKNSEKELTPEQIIAAHTKEIPKEAGESEPPVIELVEKKEEIISEEESEATEEIVVDEEPSVNEEVVATEDDDERVDGDTTIIDPEEIRRVLASRTEAVAETEEITESEEIIEAVEEEIPAGEIAEELPTEVVSVDEEIYDETSQVAKDAMTAQPPEQMASVLTQEADGQIGLVVPDENKNVVKQITGQLSIGDVMNEWARMKQEHEELNRQQYHEQIRQQTGEIFNEFEAAALNGVLETLEKESAAEIEIAEPIVVAREEIEQPEVVYEEDYTDEVYNEESYAEGTYTEGTYAEETYAEGTYDELEPAAGEVVEETEATEESEVIEETAVADETAVAEEIESVEETGDSEETEATEEASDKEIGGDTKELADASVLTRGRTVPDYYKKKIEAAKKAADPDSDEEDDEEELRELNEEEKKLFGPFIQSKSSRNQLIRVLDNISMASYTGNIILTGGDGNDTSDLATAILKDVKATDSNFSGKIARIRANNLNNKKPQNIVKQLSNGALIIDNASHLSEHIINELCRCLDQENQGIIVVLIDTETNMKKLLSRAPKLETFFTARMNVKPLTAEQLAQYGVKYAYEREFSIDEMGMLALHTQISVRQTSSHSVNIIEVRDIIDRAIDNVKKKSMGHFMDVLFGRRYDAEDMIILGEKDFN